MKTKDDLIQRIGKQLSSPVLWEKDVQVAKAMGCQSFIEIGPKPVLSSLVKSITKEMDIKYEIGFRINILEQFVIVMIFKCYLSSKIR